MNGMPSEELSATLVDFLRQTIESPDASVGYDLREPISPSLCGDGVSLVP